MALDDFITALSKEAGNPTMLFTAKGLKARLALAAERVVTGMKDETARLM